MVLEYCCFVIQLRNACLLIGYGGLIYVALNVVYLVYYGYTEDILNVTELIRICVQVFICMLFFLSSIIMLIGTYKNILRCFSVWFGFAGGIVATLVVSSLYLTFFEFHCLFPLIDIITGGVIIYCAFVTYSYYKLLSNELIAKRVRELTLKRAE